MRARAHRLNLARRLRVGPFREGAFGSPLHDQRVASVLGIALGVAFGACFLTGLLSHLVQHPPGWFVWPSRPAGVYRVTQGVHVVAGVAAVPLLLAKLWTVYPHLFTWPPVRDVAHGLERLSLLPLVGGSVFMLFTGFANTLNWYTWPFFFPAGHYWGAWVTIGALVVHVGAKATVVAASLRRGAAPARRDGLSRRGFLGTAGATAGLVALLTAGQTIRPLRRLAVLAPRDPAVGPQGLPVNKTADAARVGDAAVDPAWRLRVTGRVRSPLELSLADLRSMPQREAVLPIACVEGWSANGRWRGVRVADLLDLAGAVPGAEVRVVSLQPRGLYKASTLNRPHARDRDTLLALELNGSALHIDHGFPCRLIGPNRPGVLQTKWVSELRVR